MLPQANQARKAIWEAVNPHTGKRRIDEAFPRELRSTTLEDQMLIRFRVGSTWQVVGSDNFNSLVGSPPIGLVFSEWPLCDPAAWAYLMPILEENGGWAIFNGTPRGKNHGYRSLRAAQKTPGSFGQALSADKTGVFTAAQLTKIRAELIDVYGEEYGQSIFEQEYLVSFEAANLGAILGRGLAKAERDGRISDVFDYDRNGAPIQISSDIGRRDSSSWWFWQPCIGGYRLVDFDRDSGLDAEEWCDRLERRREDRKYKLGRIWLPHDAKAKTFSAKRTAMETFLSKFGSEIMRIVPDSSKEDRINAARRILLRCGFHAIKTEKGRDGLSAWSYEYNEETKAFSKEPLHNWASHDGDAFSYGALVLEELVPEVKEDEPIRGITVGDNKTTLDELWKTATRPSARI